jgi:adenylate kinase
LGPPGSGKGTRARLIGDIYDIPVIAVGDILRNVVSEGTGQGKIVEGYLNRGELVPDDIVIDIIEERLKKPDVSEGFVLDGFPRSMRQMVALERILKRQGTNIDHVLTVVAKPETIVDRLSLRRICSECGAVYHLKDMPPEEGGICNDCGGDLIQRKDDQEDIIRNRFEVYEKQTFPILERYDSAGKLREISGELEIEEIPTALEKVLGKPEG